MYTVSLPNLRKLKILFLLLICIFALFFLGVFHHAFEQDFFTSFQYPYDGDIEPLVLQLKNNQIPNIPTINNYNFHYYKACDNKCRGVTDLRLVYLIKSSLKNFNQRKAIRSSWGFQKRFSDVEIRTLFLIGLQADVYDDINLQISLNEESRKYNDIIQANYTDSYFNNTYKTMSGFEWVMRYCKNAKFYMFIDDDYYISTKNVLRFLRFPTNYPQYMKELTNNLIHHRRQLSQDFGLDDDVRLYTGYVFQSSPHRHYISKWYVSLSEYPYHMWPPYASGGAYILSNAALTDMYYASLYTKHFKLDDIYVGILAFKAKIEPLHSEEFCFYKKPYYKKNYQYVVASHGYSNPEELVTVWNEQKILGNA